MKDKRKAGSKTGKTSTGIEDQENYLRRSNKHGDKLDRKFDDVEKIGRVEEGIKGDGRRDESIVDKNGRSPGIYKKYLVMGRVG